MSRGQDRNIIDPLMAFVLAALCLMAVPSSASTYEYDLRAYNGGNLICGGSLDTRSDTVPVKGTATDSVFDVVGNSSGEYAALAGMGYVGMKQQVNHRLNPGWGRIFGSCSTVRTVIDDLQVVGPPGQITASLNVDLLAKIEVDTLATRSYLRITVSLKSTQGQAVASNTVNIDLSESADLDQVINSGPINFNVGEILEAELKIEMGMIAGDSPGGRTVVNVFDILDENEGYGLHFSTTEVLVLPAGYSANSIEGDVGDNQWGGTVPVEQHTWGQVKSLYR